jgi:hypothetical protein
MPVPSRSLVPRVSVPIWLAPLRTFSTFASGAAVLVFIALAAISYFPRTQFATTAGAPAAAPAASQSAAYGAGGAPAAPQASRDLSVSPAPSPAPALTDQRNPARPSATSDAAKEVGLSQNSPSANNAAADQSTRQVAAPEPAPFAFLLSPWLWLVLAVVFGALSFMVGWRLRST